MGISNLIALCIIFATAATLNANGVTDIQTSAQAAEALRPVAGAFTFALFAAGIIATGMLAVPVLAGSAAYGVSEVFEWAEGLDRRPKELPKCRMPPSSVATLGWGGAQLHAARSSQGALLECGRQRCARSSVDGRDDGDCDEQAHHGQADVATFDVRRRLAGNSRHGAFCNNRIFHNLNRRQEILRASNHAPRSGKHRRVNRRAIEDGHRDV